MANEAHLEILSRGVKVWNKWREENPDTEPDLNEAYLIMVELSEATLSRAHLSRANLGGADLNEADLNKADLRMANLSEANLSRADLRGADLSGANLGGADLSGAILGETNLSRADLSRADLSEATLMSADLRWATLSDANVEKAIVADNGFTNVDLSVVKGLDTVVHLGPSTVGIDTIYKSKGKIPEVFLRGCGVPDRMIAFIASLAGKPETNRVRLRMMIDEHFNKSELQTLCFDMGVDYDSINGENKSDKARELVAYCERRQIIPDLVAKCRELRPKVSWEGEYE